MYGCKHSVGATVSWRSKSKNRPAHTGEIVGFVPAHRDFHESTQRYMPGNTPRKTRCKADPTAGHDRYIVAVKRDDGVTEYYGPSVSRIDGSSSGQPKSGRRARHSGDSDTDPDWSRNCENCGQSPIVPVTGMCGPCTFGEAATAGGNW